MHRDHPLGSRLCLEALAVACTLRFSRQTYVVISYLPCYPHNSLRLSCWLLLLNGFNIVVANQPSPSPGLVDLVVRIRFGFEAGASQLPQRRSRFL